MNSIKAKDIHPFVRHARTVSICSERNKFTDVAAYDFRLLLITNGKGNIVIDGTDYPAEKGLLFIFPPGTPYSYYPDVNHKITLIAISFDLSFSNISKNKLPIPPVKYGRFEKDKILMPCSVSDYPELNNVIEMKNALSYEKALTDIIYEYETKLNYSDAKTSGLFLAVLADIMRNFSVETATHNEKPINSILDIIRENYSVRLTNTDIGNRLGYHPNYVNRIMIKHTGYSLHDYLINYRISRAINLLNTTRLSVTEIAEQTGFGSVTHFSACFKKKTGHRPSVYRKGF